MPFVEWRGNKCRVKWWAGEYLPSGAKKYESKSGFTDEDVAWNYGLDCEYEVRHGTHIKPRDGKSLMRDYCWAWFEAQDLHDTSLASYKSILKCWIIEQWGDRPVAEITTFEYQAWKKSLAAKVAAKRISESHKRSVLTVFGMLMSDAVELYHLRRESPIPTERKRRGKYTKPPRKKKPPLDIAVVHQLARNAHTVWGFTGWTYIWTLAFTGMRPPGEMFGFQRIYASPNWPASDPDPEQREEELKRYEGMNVLRVQYQHQWIKGERTLTPPKYASRRSLVIPPFLHEMHLALLASHTLPWVFPSLSGSCLLGTKFEETYWHPIRDGAPARAGHRAREAVPPVPEMAEKRIYMLRHGHKEWLQEDGHPEVATETRMGHEIAGVRGLYGNVTPAMERAIAASLQERWDGFVRGGDVWLPPFPSRLPDDRSGGPSCKVRAM